ncbi:hypothetical protein BRM26_08420 [Xanthomonas oryzae pv. oryzae]|nr:hypothetical protein BRL71_05980 [Xanthomonas oryzae pv. oryzae]RBG88951.1 hypothetical protein BRM26_08420 [Xanthomonas oryzae pv. oryzae]
MGFGHLAAWPGRQTHAGAGNDVNAIPSSMIERIEVLSDGASAVYGSDAIGGVVNFILRSRFDGVQFSSDVGTSSEGDGNRRNITLTTGKTWERGSLIGGLSYHNIDAVSAAARHDSKDALALTNGQPVKQGSSATPTGTVNFNDGSDQSQLLAPSNGCGRATLSSGVSGRAGPNDFHCYSASADSTTGLSSQLCNQVFHSAFIGTRSSPNITWKLCRAGFQ